MNVFLVFKLLYEFPGGNLVDGLPPVAHHGGREKAGQERANMVRSTLLWDLIGRQTAKQGVLQ